jgi:hypothetical protein
MIKNWMLLERGKTVNEWIVRILLRSQLEMNKQVGVQLCIKIEINTSQAYGRDWGDGQIWLCHWESWKYAKRIEITYED